MQEGGKSMTQSPPDLLVSLFTPAGEFYLEGLVNISSITFLVDTGVAITLMHIDAWNKLNTGNQAVRIQPWAEQKLVSIDGTFLHIYGHAVVDFPIDGTVYQTGAEVGSPPITEEIMSLDFMLKYNVSIDVGRAKFNFGQKVSIPSTQFSLSSCYTGIGEVCLEQSLKLPQLSEQVIMAYVDRYQQKGVCIVIEKPRKNLSC